MIKWLKKPPFNLSYWEWYVENWLEGVKTRLNPRTQNCCLARKPHHKMACPVERTK